MFISILAGIYATVISALIVGGVYHAAICALISVVGAALLWLAEKTKLYHLCSWLYIVAVFLLILPMLFFSSGGYKGGAFLSFGIAIIFSAILLEGYERGAALILELILYTACLLVAHYKPVTVNALEAEFDYVILTIVFFLSVSVFILATILICLRMLNDRQAQIEELNRELLDRNETLKHYDSMKTNFLATVAHEINTPLAVIAASSNDTIDLLDETPLNTGEIMENQVVIGKRVKLIDHIMLDLMDTVAIETGRLTLRRVPVYLLDLIKEVCDAQYGKPATGGHRIECELQSGLPRILLDPTRIEQVMANLLSNAFRHTRSGVVTVRLERAVTRTGGSQIISVADDGDGMDDETAQSSMNQFSTTKADQWRHGIGLYICRRIIAAHGGSIKIDSEKGRGTTVTFTINEKDWS